MCFYAFKASITKNGILDPSTPTGLNPPMQAPPGHTLITTEDGSTTLHSQRFDETCHSTSGAREETRVHYLEGCRVHELLTKHSHVHLLEVGFGTGLGWQETLALSQQVSATFLTYVSLELDEELVKWALPQATRYQADQRVWYQQDFPTAQLKVIVGDARTTLPLWRARLEKFHGIYQDAFSPRKNPTLWTTQWFAVLGSVSLPGARLSTYSASISIRKALHAAGWGVYPGPAFARKKSSTRASWNEPSDAGLIAELEKHPTLALIDTETP